MKHIITIIALLSLPSTLCASTTGESETKLGPEQESAQLRPSGSVPLSLEDKARCYKQSQKDIAINNLLTFIANDYRADDHADDPCIKRFGVSLTEVDIRKALLMIYGPSTIVQALPRISGLYIDDLKQPVLTINPFPMGQVNLVNTTGYRVAASLYTKKSMQRAKVKKKSKQNITGVPFDNPDEECEIILEVEQLRYDIHDPSENLRDLILIRHSLPVIFAAREGDGQLVLGLATQEEIDSAEPL